MDDQFQRTVETDSLVDYMVPVYNPEEYYDAAESELVSHTEVGQSARVGQSGMSASPHVGQSVGVSYSTSTSAPIGVSDTPSVAPGFGVGDRPPVAAGGDVPYAGLPMGVTTPVSSVQSPSSESSGLLSYFSRTLWPSFMTPIRTASGPETTATSSAHPSTASAGRVAPSSAGPGQYCPEIPPPGPTTLSHPPYVDHTYVQQQTVAPVYASQQPLYAPGDAAVGQSGLSAGPVGESAWSASPRVSAGRVGQSAPVGSPYPASRGTSPTCPPAGSHVGATYVRQAAAPASAPYHPTQQSACPAVTVSQSTWSGHPPGNAPYHAAQMSAYPPTDGSRYVTSYPGQSQLYRGMDHTSNNVRPMEIFSSPATDSLALARGTQVPQASDADVVGPPQTHPSRASVVDPRAAELRPPQDRAGVPPVRTPRSLIKLAPYNGTGSLETFLAKFHNIARYLEWTEADKFFHLCASLEGSAGQVLWDAGPQATTESVIRLLQTRFGNELQAERFKAELRARRRKPGEPLQQLYQEICRLVALAYPSSEVTLVHHVAKEAFITALDSRNLQLKLMEREPKTVEDALNLAIKLEAYDRSLSATGQVDDVEEDRGRPRRKKAYMVAEEEDDEASRSLRCQVTELQGALQKVLQRLDDLSTDAGCGSIPPSAAVLAAAPKAANYAAAAAGESTPVTPQQGAVPARKDRRGKDGRRRTRQSDPCNLCGQLGHWMNECNQRKAQPIVCNVLPQRGKPLRIYIPVTFRGRPIRCLLDSGCERSIIGRQYVRGMRLTKSRVVLYAANKTKLPVDGDVDIHFAVDGQSMSYNVSVSPVVDELILGIDWLTHVQCQWDFATGNLTIGDHAVKTQQRQHLATCRRIFVREECVVPPRHEANVPVRVMYDDIRNPETSWAVEPRILEPGLTTARVLLNANSPDTVARVLNHSDEPYTLAADSFFSLAEPVSLGNDDPVGQSGMSASPHVGQSAMSASPVGQSVGQSAQSAFAGQVEPSITESHSHGRVASVLTNPSDAQFEHVKCLIDRLPDDLTHSQRSKAEEFIKSRAHVFSKSEFDIGRTDVLQHRIDTEGRPPHYEPLRRHPNSQLPDIDQHVEAMIQHDVIEPAASPWCSNVVMVKKRWQYALLHRLPEGQRPHQER